jgi:hypothetical protein
MSISRGVAAAPQRATTGGWDVGTALRSMRNNYVGNQTATPDDAEVLQRIGHRGGNALENLVAAGHMPPRDVLPVGLTLLSALARLCQSDSASILQRGRLAEQILTQLVGPRQAAEGKLQLAKGTCRRPGG